MSDTDKDKPYWVTASRWEPEHWNCQYDERRRRPLRECDLPARPVVRRPERLTWRARNDWGCHWFPDDRRHPFSPVPRWYVQHVWTNVERRSVRDSARQAVAEHRATGEVDVELSVRQHRHGATWFWE